MIGKTINSPVFKQRRNCILLGLTGRTGSGCSFISSLLGKPIDELHSDFANIEDGKITNEWRQKRIVNDYIKNNWEPFVSIKASDIILYFLLILSFEDFIDFLFSLRKSDKVDDSQVDETFKNKYDPIKTDFEVLHNKVIKCENYFTDTKANDPDIKNWIEDLDFQDISKFRSTLKSKLKSDDYLLIESNLQTMGDLIRKYGSLNIKKQNDYHGFSGLSEKIDQFISNYININTGTEKRIVIDALRSPADIIFFREKYAFFYLLSVSADENVRTSNLYKANITKDRAENIDKGEEKPSGGVYDEYAKIHINRCIEMSDIHLVNYGDTPESHKRIVGQLFRYISLILHPGLVTPTKYERVMQVALTAKLNSGCLSRQVGAAVTNSYFSVMSIGWNEVPEKQVPCSLRYMSDLLTENDKKSFSAHEHSITFRRLLEPVNAILKEAIAKKGSSIQPTYCFKDIYTSGTKKQTYNQVHTRSLHAEENSFLQLAKYGNGQAVKGGKLFTTASCCVLCAKKAYQLGISEIYYIDAYPDISQSHILESGDSDIKMILFQGAIGRAYMKLYDQFMPIKDELEMNYDVKVKKTVEDFVKGMSESKKEE